MVWRKIGGFFVQFGQVTKDGILLLITNRNRERALSRTFSIGFILGYCVIAGAARCRLQVAVGCIPEFFQLTRAAILNCMVATIFITVFAASLLTFSARRLGGEGEIQPMANYMMYVQSFHFVIPFIDLIFNRILGFPYVFPFHIYPDPLGYHYDPFQALFHDRLAGLSAGIIVLYTLLIIRTPGTVRLNFDMKLSRAILATCSLIIMFWIIFIAWPFWYYWVTPAFHLPAQEDGYTLAFAVFALIALPYFWKSFRKERISDSYSEFQPISQ